MKNELNIDELRKRLIALHDYYAELYRQDLKIENELGITLNTQFDMGAMNGLRKALDTVDAWAKENKQNKN